MTPRQRLSAKLDAQTIDQLTDIYSAMLRVETTEASVLRGGVYQALARKMGDDDADALTDAIEAAAA